MAPPQACNSRILEIKLISAQDLAPVSKSMKTYAVSWVSPERKLTTRVDESNQRNPVWNDKLVFRIDDKFIYDEESTIMIEIYATAWTKDVLIGTVIVFLGDIFPRSSDNNKSSAMRFVSLQVLRPSGRPQGMLNIGIALLDSTLRSMPMFTDPATTGAKSTEKIKAGEQAKLRRVNSDQTDLTSSDVYFYPPVPNNAESACNDSSCLFKGGIYDSSACNESIVTPKGRNGINGSILNGSLISDVGPSASIVATAIAKGLYYNQPKTKNRNREDTGSLILEDTEEGAKDKLDRWRAESMYEHSRKHSKATSLNGASKLSEMDDKKSNKKGGRRQKGGGLFSCVGNVFGCEIAISCGGDDDEDGKKKKKNAKSNKVVNLSSLDGATYNSYA